MGQFYICRAFAQYHLGIHRGVKICLYRGCAVPLNLNKGVQLEGEWSTRLPLP